MTNVNPQQVEYVKSLFGGCSLDWDKLFEQHSIQCAGQSGDITSVALPDHTRGEVDPRVLARIGAELPRLRRLNLSLVELDYNKVPGVEPKFYLANLPRHLRDLHLCPGSESLRLVGDLLAIEDNRWCLSLDTDRNSGVARADRFGLCSLRAHVYDAANAPTVSMQEYVMLVRALMLRSRVVPCDVLRELLVYQANERSEEVRAFLEEMAPA
jgi:hypothetical protein